MVYANYQPVVVFEARHEGDRESNCHFSSSCYAVGLYEMLSVKIVCVLALTATIMHKFKDLS